VVKVLVVVFATAGVIGAAVAIGDVGTRQPKGAFDWELFAVVLTGFGTTGLAGVTGLLSWATWQDVRASQRAAQAAEAQLELAQTDQARRPALSLLEDGGVHSRAETPHAAYVRLVVSNERGRRAARGTRVLVDRYWPAADPANITTIGSPSLGWPSATEASDASVVVFAGTARPVDLGILARHEPGTASDPVDPYNPPEPHGPWHLKLALAGNLALSDEREYLPPGRWVVRLVIGADEADGDAYDVGIHWEGDFESAGDALAALDVSVAYAAA
jgi:hypothetical protein